MGGIIKSKSISMHVRSLGTHSSAVTSCAQRHSSCTSVCLSVSPSIYLSVCISTYTFIRLSVSLFLSFIHPLTISVNYSSTDFSLPLFIPCFRAHPFFWLFTSTPLAVSLVPAPSLSLSLSHCLVIFSLFSSPSSSSALSLCLLAF